MELEVLKKKMKNKEKVYCIDFFGVKEEIDFSDKTWHYEIIQLFGDAEEYQLGRWFALDVGGRADMDDLDTWYWLQYLRESL